MAGPAPVVYTVTPNKEPAAGGSVVQLVGRELDLASVTVTVGGVTAPVLFVSRFLIQFLAPPHATGRTNITVTTGGGSVSMNGAITYV